MLLEGDSMTKMFYRFLDRRRGTRSLNELEYLNATQWYTRQSIEKLQMKKLRRLLYHVYENVAYYKRVFKNAGLTPSDIKTKEDLKLLPLLDKETVKKNFYTLRASDFDSYKPFLSSTGGTTGRPLKYYSDVDDYTVFWADLWRVWSWAGYNLGDKRVTIGSTPSNGLIAFVRNRIMERNLNISSFDIKPENIHHIKAQIRKFKPVMLRGYPSALGLLASHFKLDCPTLKAVITTSEQLYPHQRKLLEAYFECELFDNYGCPDGGIMACECEKHSHHINSENVITEIVDGEIVVTSLSRYAMPFIRYRTGDMGELSDDKCDCGRGLEMLDELQGRLSDFITLPDGNIISSIPIVDLFNKMSSKNHIRQYQVVQDSKYKINVKIIEDDGFTEKEAENICRKLQELLHIDTNVNILLVDDIPLTKNGKRRSVISKLDVKL